MYDLRLYERGGWYKEQPGIRCMADVSHLGGSKELYRIGWIRIVDKNHASAMMVA